MSNNIIDTVTQAVNSLVSAISNSAGFRRCPKMNYFPVLWNASIFRIVTKIPGATHYGRN